MIGVQADQGATDIRVSCGPWAALKGTRKKVRPKEMEERAMMAVDTGPGTSMGRALRVSWGKEVEKKPTTKEETLI